MKLWEKDHTSLSEAIERFTVGRDREFDRFLIKADIQGNLAHTAMLAKVGLLSEEELGMIREELHRMLGELEQGSFSIDPSAEDVHSHIEAELTRRIGEPGKKIHAGRSRNDQVATDIKLFVREQLEALKDSVTGLFDQLLALSEQHKAVLMPGYTHLQVAMPSSFGLWFGAYAESLADDMELVLAAWKIINKNPLGSGAGYGSSFPLDRGMTTELLGFRSLNYNSVYAQMTRGKSERVTAVALGSVAATLARFAMDCCLYLSQNFDFIRFPAEFTTGSSLMPHKKNPDVFELIRARCNRIQSLPNELALLLANLPSGYHRDVQLTKEILFPAFGQLQDCIEICVLMLSRIEVREDLLGDDRYKAIFSVEALNELVRSGMPFREAYRVIGNRVAAGGFHYSAADMPEHTHAGSMGRLCLEEIRAGMAEVCAGFGPVG